MIKLFLIFIVISILFTVPIYEEISCNLEGCVYKKSLLLNSYTQHLDISRFRDLVITEEDSRVSRSCIGKVYNFFNVNDGSYFPTKNNRDDMQYYTENGAYNDLIKLYNYSFNPCYMKIQRFGVQYIPYALFLFVIFSALYFELIFNVK